MGRVGAAVGLSVAILCNFGVLAYAIAYFLAKPINAWYTISDYSDISTALGLIAHLAMALPTIPLGIIALVLVLDRSPPVFLDALYALCCAGTAVTGITLVIRRTSAAGPIGDVAFVAMACVVLKHAMRVWTLSTTTVDTYPNDTIATTGQQRSLNAEEVSAVVLASRRRQTRKTHVLVLFWTMFGATVFRIALMPLLIQDWTGTPIFTNMLHVIIFLNVACWTNLVPAALCTIWRCWQAHRKNKQMRHRSRELYSILPQYDDGDMDEYTAF